jgi:hypothetical protein
MAWIRTLLPFYRKTFCKSCGTRWRHFLLSVNVLWSLGVPIFSTMFEPFVTQMNIRRVICQMVPQTQADHHVWRWSPLTNFNQKWNATTYFNQTLTHIKLHENRYRSFSALHANRRTDIHGETNSCNFATLGSDEPLKPHQPPPQKTQKCVYCWNIETLYLVWRTTHLEKILIISELYYINSKPPSNIIAQWNFRTVLHK